MSPSQPKSIQRDTISAELNCQFTILSQRPHIKTLPRRARPTSKATSTHNHHTPGWPVSRSVGRSVTRGAHVPRGRTVVDQQAAGVHELVRKYSESTLCRKNKIKIHKNRPTLTPTRHEITYDSSTVDKLLRIFWQHKNVSSTSPMCCCGHHNIISLANQRRGDE